MMLARRRMVEQSQENLAVRKTNRLDRRGIGGWWREEGEGRQAGACHELQGACRVVLRRAGILLAGRMKDAAAAVRCRAGGSRAGRGVLAGVPPTRAGARIRLGSRQSRIRLT